MHSSPSTAELAGLGQKTSPSCSRLVARSRCKSAVCSSRGCSIRKLGEQRLRCLMACPRLGIHAQLRLQQALPIPLPRQTSPERHDARMARMPVDQRLLIKRAWSDQ